jgi:hypothetical protein
VAANRRTGQEKETEYREQRQLTGASNSSREKEQKHRTGAQKEEGNGAVEQN